jgi:hypothetical protein
MGVVSCGTTMLDQGVFENIGSVTWDTTAKTSGFTAVSGNGYFCNTTSAAFTVTLPSSPSAGDIVGIKDYANTADTNNITIGRNGSDIQGVANDYIINTEGRSVILVYVDATKGWLVTGSAKSADIAEGPTYIVATGGTITCCGDYKIHTFTGPGTFTVCSVGNPLGGPNNVDYLVVAGGGAGGNTTGGGGGGAGGYRTSYPSPAGTVPISVQGYSITVGGGGTGAPSGAASSQGSSSIFSTITSTGGGRGAYANAVPGGAGTSASGGPGGSGGGGRYNTDAVGGSGNSPPVSPPQGNNGGSGSNIFYTGSGGGGASTTGNTGTPTSGGAGGAGSSNLISGSSVAYAGGGGGGKFCQPGTGGAGGTGGGGAGNNTNFQLGTAGTVNTGGGSGASDCGSSAGVNGGSGIVIIRYKFQ